MKTDTLSFLRRKKLFIFDLDGTIYLDGKLFPKSLELLKRIRSLQGEYVFFTNNSSISTSAYVAKINNLGIPCQLKNVATSTEATIAYIKDHHRDKLFYVMGTASMKQEISQAGVRITDVFEDDIQGVVIAYDTELNYQKLIDVTRLLNHGKTYLATNPDLVCPVAFGFVPDCGSFAIMLENATNRKPKYLGKPEPAIIDMILARTGYDKEDAVLVGDRLYTDIQCGINAGIDTVLVLSGETKIGDLEYADVKPTLVVQDVSKLLAIINE